LLDEDERLAGTRMEAGVVLSLRGKEWVNRSRIVFWTGWRADVVRFRPRTDSIDCNRSFEISGTPGGWALDVPNSHERGLLSVAS
jgi:hypothetical protein